MLYSPHDEWEIFNILYEVCVARTDQDHLIALKIMLYLQLAEIEDFDVIKPISRGAYG